MKQSFIAAETEQRQETGACSPEMQLFLKSSTVSSSLRFD
jgi:hypothetical protein